MIARKTTARETPRVHCSFTLAVENLTPDEVSARLSLQHDGGLVFREHSELSFDADFACSWHFRSRTDPRAPASEHVNEIMDRLAPCREELRKLLDAGALAQIRLALLGTGLFLPFELPPALARRIADLDVGLTVYYSTEDDWDTAIADVVGTE